MSKMLTGKTVVSFKDRNHAIDALCRKVFGAEPSYGEDIPSATPRTGAGWRVVEPSPGDFAVETDTGIMIEVSWANTLGEELDFLARIARLPQLERDLALCQAGNRVYAEHNSKLTDERDRLTLQLAQATEALETERIRLAAVGVVATADTRESRDRARDMLPEYRSASLSGVERRVDECIELREKCDALIAACQWAQVELGKHTRPSPIDAALAMVERREG